MSNAPYITKVYLLDIPLENDYKNTLYFTSEQAQHTYFSEHIVKSYTDFSYQRKDNIIRVPDQYDTIYNVNYVMYQNTNYNNKWFYAFITDLRYINDGLTDISIETDVIQTWFFEYQIKQCFIDREHTNNDTVGNNTQPEGLETGDFITDQVIPYNGLATSGGYYVMASSTFPYLDANDQLVGGNDGGGKYNGIYNGLGYYAFSRDSAGTERLNKVIKAFDSAGQSARINCIFVAPSLLVNEIDWEGSGYVWGRVRESNTAFQYSWEAFSTPQITRPTSLNGYTPRNKKLLTSPYCYLLMSNGNGGQAKYNYELFRNGANYVEFAISTVICPGMSTILEPLQYKVSSGYSENENLIGAKFPVCGWVSDTYTNWLTQNSLNIKLGIIGGAFQIASGIASAGAINPAMSMGEWDATTSQMGNAIGGGIGGILGSMKQVYLNREFMPPQAEGNINCGDVNFSRQNTTFTAYKMSIKSEFASRIDSYFDMFGYKTNQVKVPNTNHRQRWWYTKTIDAVITGSIPNNDIEKIKSIYNNGVTFWKNASDIGNYSLSNNII